MSNLNIEPELNSLLSKLTVEISNDSKEIEILKKRIEKNEALLRAVRGSLSAMHPESKATGYGAKSEIIRDAINRLPKTQFTQDELEAEIRRVHVDMDLKRSRLRSALWTMSRNGKIKLSQKGTNKKPAVYERIGEMIRVRRATEQHKEQTLRNVHPRSSPLTAQEIERSVQEKSYRVNDLAEHLGTTPTQIMSMLEPASRVYVTERGGWLRLRE